jgi:hypothetical protein
MELVQGTLAGRPVGVWIERKRFQGPDNLQIIVSVGDPDTFDSWPQFQECLPLAYLPVQGDCEFVHRLVNQAQRGGNHLLLHVFSSVADCFAEILWICWG